MKGEGEGESMAQLRRAAQIRQHRHSHHGPAALYRVAPPGRRASPPPPSQLHPDEACALAAMEQKVGGGGK